MAENLKQIIEFQAKGIQKLKGQYKDLERRTKGLEGQTKRTSGAMGGMIAKLGLTTVALYGVSRAMSGVVRVGKTFEKNMSNVAAISGATGQELKDLEENAKQLGSTTVFTASQVAELQVEFAKLGFSGKQITNVTKDTLALASATGSELSTAAAVAGQTLRAFGLDVTQMSRVTDTMAKSFSASALDMDKFTNSMTYVAPVAKSVGFSVEGTTALLGGLANAGISGSMAGTALRTVFLKLADSNSGLSKALGGSVKTADQLLPALKKLKDGGIDLTAMLELVDKRAISAFDVLLNNTQTVADLKTELDNAAGAAQDMANIQLANFEGKVTLLNSAMEGLGITLFSFVSEPLTDLVTGTTDFINALDEEKIKAYTTAFAGIGVAIGAYNSAILIAKLRTIQFQATLVKTGWGALIVGAGLAIGKLLEMSDVFKELTDEMAIGEETAKKLNERAFKQLAPSEQIERIKQTKLNLLETFEQGAKGADSFMSFIKSLSISMHDQALTSEEVQRLQTLALKNGIIQRKILMEEEATNIKEKDEKKTFMDDFNKAELAIYQQYLSQRQQITTLSQDEEEAALVIQHDKLKEMLTGNAEELAQLEKFINAQREANNLKHFNNMMNIYSGFASAFAGFLGEFAGAQKASARLSQISAIIDTYAGANAALKTQPHPLGLISAASIVATGLANVMQISKSIGEFTSAETGFDGVVNKPTMFMTGESNKAEHVSITPLESPNISGGQGGGAININISAPLVDETVVDSIIPAIERAKLANLA